MKENLNIRTVDEYISLQKEIFRPTLEAIRSLVKEEIPEVAEMISYQVPCFKHHFMLAGMGVTKKYCSFYTMNKGLVTQMQAEIDNLGIKVSGTTLHFVPGQPLPTSLLLKFIQAKKEINELKAMLKSTKIR